MLVLFYESTLGFIIQGHSNDTQAMISTIQASSYFQCGRYQLPLSRPHVMGIVNVTPDSFSDGGQHDSTEKAVAHALQLVAEGADILDIGGESTRPGAEVVPLEEELRRVIPVIEALRDACDVPISIDTYKPAVMQAAIEAGADLVNDVNALRADGAEAVVAANNKVGVCLMHLLGTPQTMQNDPTYGNVTEEVAAFLQNRLSSMLDQGVAANRIVLDPGFGFGKRTVHNLSLAKALPALCELGQPLLVGLSRKSVLGQVIGAEDKSQRLYASVAAAVLAVMKGAFIVRVHDVKATVEALKVVNAVSQAA